MGVTALPCVHSVCLSKALSSGSAWGFVAKLQYLVREKSQHIFAFDPQLKQSEKIPL